MANIIGTTVDSKSKYDDKLGAVTTPPKTTIFNPVPTSEQNLLGKAITSVAGAIKTGINDLKTGYNIGANVNTAPATTAPSAGSKDAYNSLQDEKVRIHLDKLYAQGGEQAAAADRYLASLPKTTTSSTPTNSSTTPSSTGTSTKTSTSGTSVYKPLGTYNDADVSAEDKARLEAYGRAYNDAKAKGDTAGMEAAHQGAEGIRAGYSYSGGADGSQNIGLGDGGTAVPGTGTNGLTNMQSMLGNMSKGYVDKMSSAAQIARDAEIAELQQSLAQAVEEGKISVRDAQAQFDEQKKGIEQKAYVDAERTGLYANDMGIQNSQQMLGLQAGDNARTNANINANVNERDRRINDVKDRINALKNQTNIGIAKANANYGSRVLGYQGEAMQNENQNLFDLAKGDYEAARNFNYDTQMLEKEFGFDVKKMQEGSRLNVEEMFVGRDIDFAKMDKAFGQDLEKMATDFGYSSALSSQSFRQSANLQAQAAQNEIAAIKSEYDIAVQRELAKFVDGTPEYTIRQNQLKEGLKTDIANIVVEKQTAALVDSIMNDPMLSRPKPTAGVTTKTSSIFGSPFSYGYNSGDNSELDAWQAAVDRRTNFQADPLGTLGVMDIFK